MCEYSFAKMSDDTVYFVINDFRFEDKEKIKIGRIYVCDSQYKRHKESLIYLFTKRFLDS